MRDGEYLNDDNNLECKVKNDDDVPWWERIKDDTTEKQEGSKPELEFNAGPAEHFFTWSKTKGKDKNGKAIPIPGTGRYLSYSLSKGE
jgi:hypothetical protein